MSSDPTSSRRWSRRTVLAGLGGLTTLGCTGLGSVPTPAGDAPGGGGPAPSDLDAGTLFRPGKGGQGPNVKLTDSPRWFQELPGLYNPDPRSAGAALLLFSEGKPSSLSRRISHFRELPKLLGQARSLGTDLVYLVGYYEGWEGQEPEEYWRNKGPYVPREDMGGPRALERAIAEVHDRGGRVMLYVEPFVIHHNSPTGKRHGEDWTIRTKKGVPEEPYPNDWKLCPAVEAWQAHLEGVVRRLVGTYGADAIFFDSAGFQDGWRCVAKDHGHPLGDPKVFDRGMNALIARMAEAIRDEKSDAVLMCEGPTMPVLFTDISSSQDWGIHRVVDRWLWDRAGSIPVFSAGWSLDDLHQLVALGHKLSLGDTYWLRKPPGDSARAWLDGRLRDDPPRGKNVQMRRYWFEDLARGLHAWRNAAILGGLAVPAIDDATPRRGEHMDLFEDDAGMDRLVQRMRDAADAVDAAIGSADVSGAPTAHVKELLDARRALSAAVIGARIEPVSTDAPDTLAWSFRGGEKRGYTAVTTSNAGASVTVQSKKDLKDLTSGEVLSSKGGSVEVALAPHSVRMFLPA